MPKYRLLTNIELEELEKEFINYLVLNGITAEDWLKQKTNDISAAEKIIESFSDAVFERILKKINYMEYRDKNSVYAFQCQPDKLVVVTMSVSNSENVDFTDNAFIKNAAINPPSSIKVFTTEKIYKQNRASELFEMLQTGCVIADGTLFKTLCLFLTK
ncbi:MAG TPA: DUF6495 family protein [Cytophagaceae bacterium]|jgi:hypothetical protein|nr:DUF6495 family protein [Cytophagaceae bacterium]